jgi:hypothetical protein
LRRRNLNISAILDAPNSLSPAKGDRLSEVWDRLARHKITPP